MSVTPTANIRDGYLVGTIVDETGCGRCGKVTHCVRIAHVDLPSLMTPAATILKSSKPNTATIRFLGIGCGCYGKFHRQIVHIMNGR